MIRTTTRVMGAILIALFGLSTVHLSAADNILPVATFGDELDSIALNTLLKTAQTHVCSLTKKLRQYPLALVTLSTMPSKPR